MNYKSLLTFLFLVIALHSKSQKLQLKQQQTIEWGDCFASEDPVSKQLIYLFNVKNGSLDHGNYSLPTCSKLEPLDVGPGTNNLKASVSNLSFSTIALTALEKKIVLSPALLSTTPSIKVSVVTAKNKTYLSVKIVPLIVKGGEIFKLTNIRFNVALSAATSPSTSFKTKKTNNAANAIDFTKGNWHRFRIHQTGIHKITYEELLTLNVLSGSTPSAGINLYGAEGKMLPFLLSEDRPNLLSVMNIEMNDGNDGEFGPGDYFLFYGEAGAKSIYNKTTNRFTFDNNYYSDSNFVFLNTQDISPARVSSFTNTSPPVGTFTSRDVAFHHENEWLNFIKSGRTWVGEDLQGANAIKITVPSNHVPTENIWLKLNACARSLVSYKNKVSIVVNGDTLGNLNFPIVSSIYHNDYVKFSDTELNFLSPQKELVIEVFYHKPDPAALAWLDYFTLNYQQENILGASSLIIQNKNALLNPDNYAYEFESSSSNPKTWAIDQFNNVKAANLTKNGNTFSFTAHSNTYAKFIAFDESHALTTNYIGKVTPHQLNVTVTPEYLIVAPPLFIKEANRLAAFHRKESNLKTLVVNSEEIYNLYSSGRKEAGAIRDYIKYLYDHPQGTDTLQYVLLFGSGSFDPKNREQGNLDLIPTYQSANSIKLTASYVTDDFYGVMDDLEGDFINNDQLDLSVGRFPVKTVEQATIAVDKVHQYYGYFSSKKANGDEYSTFGSWKNRLLFVADDGDLNEHVKQAENLATLVDSSLQNLNIDKVYIDAYLKESAAWGTSAKDAKAAVFRKLQEGALIINYTGHGGEYGWASERILDVNNILKFKNRERLPLVMTATCEFSRFDDPQRISAGEYLYLQENGGAIALFTTVRLVFSIPNFNLNKQFYNVLVEEQDRSTIRIGDLFRKTKLKSNAGTNDRNFTLLGDPALRLAIPQHEIVIDSILSWKTTKTDTLKALGQATVFGKIKNDNQLHSEFSGTIELLIYDKKINTKTLGNSESPYPYTSQNSLLYKGMMSVQNGFFSGDVILPKSTLSNFGNAKISLYAYNSTNEAKGFDKNYTIGGTDSLAPSDYTGPAIEVFLNDSNFSFGDRVTQEPFFIAQLSDESGINVTSNNIENNIVLTLDNSPELEYLLNNEYQTELNTFKKGTVQFQLGKLKNGNHSLEFSASDNYNNRSKHYTEFVIQENAELALEHVLNYPNPFTTNTGFYFEQNQLNAELEVLIQIYTISGKLIKTILTPIAAHQPRIGPINWDGKDDFGDSIGRGVYIYKIKVRADNGTVAEEIQKLVILK